MESEGERARRALLERRRDVLELLEGTPRTQAEVAEALAVSRSTVTRATAELEEFDLVRRHDGRLEATPVGAALLRAHERYARTVDAVTEAGPVLQYLPDEAPFDPAILVDGTLHSLEAGSGFEVRERVNEVFRAATGVFGVGRTWSEREAGSIIYDLAVERGHPVEMVMSSTLFEHVRTRGWSPSFFRADSLTTFVAETVPYGLFVLDQPEGAVMLLVIYDADGAMKGLIESSAPYALSWAESVYESYREAAVPRTEYTGAD